MRPGRGWTGFAALWAAGWAIFAAWDGEPVIMVFSVIMSACCAVMYSLWPHL